MSEVAPHTSPSSMATYVAKGAILLFVVPIFFQLNYLVVGFVLTLPIALMPESWQGVATWVSVGIAMVVGLICAGLVCRLVWPSEATR